MRLNRVRLAVRLPVLKGSFEVHKRLQFGGKLCFTDLL
jgi:hypothetical protein